MERQKNLTMECIEIKELRIHLMYMTVRVLLSRISHFDFCVRIISIVLKACCGEIDTD